MAENTPIEPRKRRKRKHPWAFPLGFAIILLAIIGAATLIVLAAGGVKKLTDKSALKTEYETFLAQVVRNDPQFFEDIKNANQADLLDSAIWSFLKDDGLSKKDYSYSETEPVGYIVPLEDIEPYYQRLFGSEYTPVYDTVNGPGYTFTYDLGKNSYIVPLTGVDPIYIPKVYEIDKQGDSTILTVGYLESLAWSLNQKGVYTRPSADKYVEITLRQTDDRAGYYVSAIRASEPPDNADPAKKETTTEPVTTIPAESESTAAISPSATTAAGGTTGKTGANSNGTTSSSTGG